MPQTQINKGIEEAADERQLHGPAQAGCSRQHPSRSDCQTVNIRDYDYRGDVTEALEWLHTRPVIDTRLVQLYKLINKYFNIDGFLYCYNPLLQSRF